MSTKKSNVKVSIITPVYNVEKFLGKCIDSILAQTLKDIEIILIDDGSSDGSWSVIQEYAKKDNRVIAIQQENAGAAVARNRGLEVAKGEYIGFVDSDDWVDADYFENLYNTGLKQDADIVCAYVETEVSNLARGSRFSVSVDQYNKSYNVRMKDAIRENKFSLDFVIWLNIYRKSMLDRNNITFVPELRTGQDSVFNTHTSYYANKVITVEKPVYYHINRRDGSLMTGYNYTIDGILSRALVFEETVRFMNSVEDYNKEMYKKRIYRVLNFIYSRIVKTPKLTRSDYVKIGEALIGTWSKAQYKDEILASFGNSKRFEKSLSSVNGFIEYVRFVMPAKRTVGYISSRRQVIASDIRGNKFLYRALRPPVHAARKVNKLIDKLLS